MKWVSYSPDILEVEGGEFSIMAASWLKLLLSLVEQAWRLRYLFPDGRSLAAGLLAVSGNLYFQRN